MHFQLKFYYTPKDLKVGFTIFEIHKHKDKLLQFFIETNDDQVLLFYFKSSSATYSFKLFQSQIILA